LLNALGMEVVVVMMTPHDECWSEHIIIMEICFGFVSVRLRLRNRSIALGEVGFRGSGVQVRNGKIAIYAGVPIERPGWMSAARWGKKGSVFCSL